MKLDDINFFDPEINELFRSWREAIENANNWTVTKGGSSFHGDGKNGFSLDIPKLFPGLKTAVVTTAITTGSSSTLGSGKAMIRKRQPPGLTLRDASEVIVLNPFTLSASLPVGRIIVIGYERPDWLLIGANCP